MHNLEGNDQRVAEYSVVAALPRDPRFEPWSIEYWREWLLEPDKSEETLRPYTRALTGAFQKASFNNDYRGMERVLGVLNHGYCYCSQEPFLTPYESTLMFVSTIIADRLLALGELARSLHDLARIEACLLAGDARRRQLQMIERPNSELRLNLLGLQAGCMADPLSRGLDLTMATSLCHKFWDIADKLEVRLLDVSEQHRAHLLGNVATREIEVCKLAFKVGKDLFAEAVHRFNGRYGSDVSSEACLDKYDQQVQTAWFWDMEVWKHLHVPNPNQAALAHCRWMREAGLQLCYGSEPADCIRAYWRRRELAS